MAKVPPCLLFLAADTTPDQNRVELLQELARWAAMPLDSNDYRSWRNVFRLFVDLAKHESLVVILGRPHGNGDDVISHVVKYLRASPST